MKDRKIPPESRVVEEVNKVLSTRLSVESQEDLCELVLKRLKKIDKNFTLSPIRVKRIALQIPEIEVKAKTKKTVRLQKIDKCPICDSSIKPLEVRNLLNNKITIGYSCTKCAYQSDLEAFMPMKYIFIYNPAIKKANNRLIQ